MTTVEQSNKVPIKQRPVLRLKLGPSSSEPRPPDPVVPAQRPSPPPRPAPAAAEPLAARVKVSETIADLPPAPRKFNAERAASISEEKAVAAERLAIRAAIHQRSVEMREALAERFPLCFKPVGQPLLPLKIGIDKDIFAAAPELSRHDITNMMTDYVNSPDYQLATIEGAVRVDLDGKEAGIVTSGHAQWAKSRRTNLSANRSTPKR